MSQKLTKKDLEIIQDEVTRYQNIHARIVKEVKQKTIQLKDNQELARDLTSQIVATQRDEEKQALQSDESVAHSLAKLRKEQSQALSDLVEQPYFARVIYHEKKDVEFKLGLASFPELRIIDWRKAPISKLYYDYEEGDEYDDEIAGVERQGQIKLKRAYRGKDDVLSAIELPDISYIQSRGQWYKQKKSLKTVFSLKDKEQIKELLKSYDFHQYEKMEAESGYLHNVLSLLTPEQFRMISLEVDKPVIIQGSAGTGKTTVALHRLAWLMYEGNSLATEENTLVLMFNKSLAAYVKHVLPELGIHHVNIVTFFDWANNIIQTMLGKELQFIESDIPYRAARFKAHHKTLQNLDSFLRNTNFTEDPTQILKKFYESSGLRQVLDQLYTGQEIQIYLNHQLKTNFLDIYDMAFILHILFKQNNCYRSKKFPVFLDYLIIDEAQDFTIVELKAVLNALENKKMLTLAGDLGQRILENRDFGDWEELLDELGLKGVDVMNLNIAYRSTYQIYEISEYVRDPNLKEDDLHFTPKFGPDPTLTQCHGFSDAILETKKWLESIVKFNRHAIGAIICKTRAEARAVYDALIKIGSHGLRYGDAQHFEFTPGITVTDVHQVKGLEFKNVLIFNPSEHNYNKNHIHDRNLLYVAMTRAEHRLDMISYDDPSALIPKFIAINDLTRIEESNADQTLFSDTDQDLTRFEEEE